MSYTSLTYHIVFSTYRRMRTIPEERERILYKIIYDILTEKKVYVRRIGGMPDHVHILCDIPASLAVATVIRSLKTETSKFLSQSEYFPDWDKWSEGYCCIVVEPSTRQTRMEYIRNQKEHHRVHDFKQELRDILAEYGIPMRDDSSECD